jgi:hypothetical protein
VLAKLVAVLVFMDKAAMALAVLALVVVAVAVELLVALTLAFMVVVLVVQNFREQVLLVTLVAMVLLG